MKKTLRSVVGALSATFVPVLGIGPAGFVPGSDKSIE
jgi:hypothetical protein